ncbi:substrate-binding domain-containing protein [Nafulsella turpanensis]|uniref:substrate-binding domain-containing protein n=1 Tax=Nafulsella turpanensis TaxID=1265690 RepID=UPI00034CB44B|nr:substrate-binding domain-containing protein [Nafulsella turpanensis]
MQNTDICIGGVPEHFNLPWHLAIEKNLFKAAGIGLQWQDYPGGTGAMAKDLHDKKLDMALLLTEGAVTDIIRGGNHKIAGLFVNSPLVWGIHVHKESPFKQVKELEGKTFAISRYGSGSHLMAFVNAQQQGWRPHKLQFELVGNLEGAREAMANGQADGFMWEKFMTKPLVDNGEWRRIGECPTPWPCFVAVVREDIAESRGEEIRQLLDIVRTSAQQLQQSPEAATLIADRYQLQKEDAALWLRNVRWATDNTIETDMLRKVVDTLYQLDLIDRKAAPEELCNSLCRLIP